MAIENRIWIPIALSVIAFIIAIYWFVRLFRHDSRERTTKDGFPQMKKAGKELMFISIALLVSAWMLRLAVGLFSAWVEAHEGIPEMPWPDQVANSFLHGLQTFSMDENYTAYLEHGRKMIEHLLPKFAAAPGFYAVYNSALNVTAPIIGGAFVFEILANVFPQIRFWVTKHFLPHKEFFYFSALNDQSIAMAKNILLSEDYQHPCVVFTDAYTDDENEESTEWLLQAKAIGAIVLRDDLLHISFRPLKFLDQTVRLFLVDQKEDDNLSVLAALLDDKEKKSYDTKIYIFATDKKKSDLEDAVSAIVNMRCVQLLKEHPAQMEMSTPEDMAAYKKYKEDLFVDNMPQIIPVNRVCNLARNLFRDYPLFEAAKEDPAEPIKLTIFGSGSIGTELFLSAYWLGQILHRKLLISIVSKEKQADFEGRINYLNPEIMLSNGWNENRGKVLQYEMNGKPMDSEPYFYYHYYEKDVKASDLRTFLGAPAKHTDAQDTGAQDKDDTNLLDTDYFIVAFGSDEENYSIAEHLRRLVGSHHMYEAPDNKTIISYVIYDSALCKELNQQMRFRYAGAPVQGGAATDDNTPKNNPDEFDVYMHAFGSLEEVFSLENIFYAGIRASAQKIGDVYARGIHGDRESEKVENKAGEFLDYYNYQANLGRRLHRCYKAYSAGSLKPTLFFSKDEATYRQCRKDGAAAYRSFVLKPGKTAEELQMVHELAWLEHRRWCAFMRANGFRRPKNFETYFYTQSDVHDRYDHKMLSLKLHPSILEIPHGKIRADLDDAGRVIESTEFRGMEKDESGHWTYPDDLDPLDRLGYRIYELRDGRKWYDFKRWDYPSKEGFD